MRTLKPRFASARQFSTGAFLLACAAAASVAHCNTSTTNNGSKFVGTWSCPASLAPLSQTLVITENLDDSLTLGGESDGGSGGTFCATDLWTYSGSTATMKPGTSCTGGPSGAEVITVNSFTLSVSGGTLTVNANETVATQSTEADGSPVGAVTKSVLKLSGSCTMQ